MTTLYTPDNWTCLSTNTTPDTVNGVQTATAYDGLGRPTLITEATGTSSERETLIQYSLQNRFVMTRKDQTSAGDGKLITAQHFDTRGRLWRSQTLEDDNPSDVTPNPPTAGILVDTQYYLSSAGRCMVQSNPYRSNATSDPTMGWTLTNQDTMGRPVSVVNIAGGAIAPPCGSTSSSTGISYITYNNFATFGSANGVMTQTMDQAGSTRQTVEDGLGRLIGVVEDPSALNYQTGYTYDALDDLTQVTQGSQTRSFVYDSLKRLSSSSQPEMNPLNYTYTDNGLVNTKTDGNGNGVVTTYAYDDLNRLFTETHSNSAASANLTWCYDGTVTNGDGMCVPGTGIPFAHGRKSESRSNLAAPGIVSLATSEAFDPLGRVVGSRQTTAGLPFALAYTYDLADSPLSITYPSGRVVTNAYDLAERPTTVTGTTVGGATTQYVSGASYWAPGELNSMTLNASVGGASWTEGWTYNNMLQASNLCVGAVSGGCTSGAALFSLALAYNNPNNGNLATQTIGRGSSSWMQSYLYDGVNRLTSAAESGSWSRTFGYDQYGNGWVTASPGVTLSPYTPIGSSNFDGGNRLVIQNITSASYDAAGNQLVQGAYTFGYDSAGRVESSSIGGSTTVNAYDAEGHRVLKQQAAGNTIFVYDAFGQMAAEADGQVSTALCATCYVAVDQLGSTRLVVNGANGSAVGCHDFLPFGEEIPAGVGGRSGGCWGAMDTAWKFTGKERDTETGLDYFGARYMSSAQGRFTSPDPSFESAILELPQSWNKYSYVYNRPLFGTDPDGRCPICVGAIVGGVVEGGWSLGSQFIDHGYSFTGTDWGQVGANFVGGAVAGGLAVATGGTSLFSNAVVGDLAAGAVSTVAGGIATRTAEGQGADEVFAPGDIATDAVSGFVGGGVGHVAADLIHVPDERALPGSRRHAVGRRQLAKYDASVAARNNALRVQAGIGVAAASPPTHGVTGFINNFWSALDWLVSPSPPSVARNGTTSTFRPCSERDTSEACK